MPANIATFLLRFVPLPLLMLNDCFLTGNDYLLDEKCDIVTIKVQSALTVAEESKRQQETRSLLKINDSFVKIVVVRDNIIRWYDEAGILYIGIEDFLLNSINTME